MVRIVLVNKSIHGTTGAAAIAQKTIGFGPRLVVSQLIADSSLVMRHLFLLCAFSLKFLRS